MNYLFFKFTKLNIFRPTYWAKIFITIIQGIVLLPVYILLSKAILGCSEFIALRDDGTLKWLYALLTLLLWGINYLYYNPNKIKKIDRKYRSYTGITSHLRLGAILILIIVWEVKAGDMIKLIVDIPFCH